MIHVFPEGKQEVRNPMASFNCRHARSCRKRRTFPLSVHSFPNGEAPGIKHTVFSCFQNLLNLDMKKNSVGLCIGTVAVDEYFLYRCVYKSCLSMDES